MIGSIEKITLYVKSQRGAKDFRTKRMGFIVRLEQRMGADKKWLEVEPEISWKLPYNSMFQFYDMGRNVFLLREEARIH